jgi:hypothetical protein
MDDWLAQKFEENRPHLRAVAHRMLGSLGDRTMALTVTSGSAVSPTWPHRRHLEDESASQTGCGAASHRVS